ncbi:hypothetical protein BJY52DRAFT_1111514, partial [Lactarius psammicola]
LRAELRDYFAILKEELVQPVNDVRNTDLRGEGTRLERLKWPLGDLERFARCIYSCFVLTSISLTYLHLLLKISESVTRRELLLLIASPDGPSSPELKILLLADRVKIATIGPRGNRTKHLARVAAEYTNLLYHVTKAQTDTRSTFVDEIQWRISRIQSTLSLDLDHLFSDTAIALST